MPRFHVRPDQTIGECKAEDETQGDSSRLLKKSSPEFFASYLHKNFNNRASGDDSVKKNDALPHFFSLFSKTPFSEGGLSAASNRPPVFSD